MAKKQKKYSPPFTFQQMADAGYPDETIHRLMECPVHSWRAETGIELIHREPTQAEQERIWENWLLMTAEQKAISEAKSIELFSVTNESHHRLIRGL